MRPLFVQFCNNCSNLIQHCDFLPHLSYPALPVYHLLTLRTADLCSERSAVVQVSAIKPPSSLLGPAVLLRAVKGLSFHSDRVYGQKGCHNRASFGADEPYHHALSRNWSWYRPRYASDRRINSSWVPKSSTRPASMTRMRSASPRVDVRWVIRMVVRWRMNCSSTW